MLGVRPLAVTGHTIPALIFSSCNFSSKVGLKFPILAKMKALTLLSLIGCLIMANEAKIFSRCELAYTLHEEGLDGYEGYSLANCEF